MTAPTPTVQQLMQLPRAERREALTDIVEREFKETLFMTDSDDLPIEQSFFDLGLTSLRITEIKQRLETLLGREIDANSLFNSPTLTQLMIHLTDEVLPELFHAPAATGGPATDDPGTADDRAAVDDLLMDLYQS